jgi:hypothetical protein
VRVGVPVGPGGSVTAKDGAQYTFWILFLAQRQLRWEESVWERFPRCQSQKPLVIRLSMCKSSKDTLGYTSFYLLFRKKCFYLLCKVLLPPSLNTFDFSCRKFE